MKVTMESSEYEEDVKEECCEFWDKAHRKQTDNECYGSLVSYDEKSASYIGDSLPPVKFCPWCASPKN